MTALKNHLPLILLVVGVAILRIHLVLSNSNYLGVDGGAYLLSTLDRMGYEQLQAFTRLPLGTGYTLIPFINLFGLDIGYKLFSVTFSLAPILAVYYFSRIWLSKNQSLIPSAFIAFDMEITELLVTGILPAWCMAVLLCILGAIIRNNIPQRQTFINGLIIVFGVPLIVFSNHTTAAIALYVIPVFLITLGVLYWQDNINRAPMKPKDLLIRTNEGKWKRPNILQLTFAHLIDWLFRSNRFILGTLSVPFKFAPSVLCLILGGLISVFALPYYFSDEVAQTKYIGDIIYFSRFPFDAAYWYNIPIGLSLGILGFKNTKSKSLKAISILLIVVTAMTPFLSNDERIINIFYRSRYFMAFLTYPILTYLIINKLFPKIRRLEYTNSFNLFFYALLQKGKYAILIIAILILAQESIHTFRGQSVYSDQITQDTLKMLEVSGSNVIASNFSQAHWVAAILKPSKRIPHRWNTTPHKIHQAEHYYVECLYGNIINCDKSHAKKTLDVDYILINGNDALSTKNILKTHNALKSKYWLTPVMQGSKNNEVLYKISLDS